jgi:hypothetical protein
MSYRLPRQTNNLTQEDVSALVSNRLANFTDNGTVKRGNWKSGNFVSGSSGWRITANGDAEFNSGTFRGTFTIGGTVITIGPTDDIQDALDTIDNAGGGTLYLQAGTYNVSSNIVVPSSCAIIGAGLSTIIDFGGGAFQMQVVGSNNYSTGTVAINNDATTVVGTGTTFTSAMVGRQILLEDFWYTISAFTDTTHITIDRPYMGTNLSGASYMIATTVGTVNLEDFLLQGSSTALLKVQYANGVNIDGVLPFDGSIGIDIDDSAFINIFNSGADTCDTGMTFEKVYFGTFFNNNITECSTAGVTFNTIRNWCIDVFAFVNISGNAMSFTSCSNNDVLDFSIQHVTGKGIEFVSGNSDIGVTAGVIKDCTSDGIKLTATSDSIVLGAGLNIHDNGGWGVNIAASTCDNNIIVGDYFANNSSGDVTDSGTGTIKRANSPASINQEGYVLTHRNISGAATPSPADATTYYITQRGGGAAFANTTSDAGTRIYIPKSGTIKTAYGTVSVDGTLSSGEDSTISIRLNDTTSTNVSTTVETNGTTNSFSNTNLSIAVAAGDFIDVLFTTPTWATNPTGVYLTISLFIE